MALDFPQVIARLVLSSDEARQVWNWLLSRQGLGDGAGHRYVLNVANVTLGLHAARLPSPFATTLARSATPDVALRLLTAKTRKQVVTLRCMRKTLHTLPLDLASAAHAATLHFRERDALRAITNSNIGSDRIMHAANSLTSLLSECGLVHYREIETRLAGEGASIVATRLALKLAWERGELAYVNDTSWWNRETRKFGLTGLIYPALDTTVDRRKATRILIDAYFDRYGPASLVDAAWWSGLSRISIVTAMRESGREYVQIGTPWTTSPMYMSAKRYLEFRAGATAQRRVGLNFLAHEDVALKAYYETRGRYLSDLAQDRAFNQIGEALPTVTYDGQVIGTWLWNAATKMTETRLVSKYMTKELDRAVSSRARQLTNALRLGYAQT